MCGDRVNTMSLPHALLGLLAEQPASGYELAKLFDLSLANVWPAKHSQIYPALAKLSTSGFVVASEEGPRGRKEYTITDDGRAELERWLVEEPSEHAVRHDDLLRAFFLWTLGADGAVAHFEREAADANDVGQQFTQLYRDVDWDDSDAALYAAIVLEQGRRWSAMRAEWSLWAVEQINAHRTAKTLTGRLPDSAFDPPAE